MTDNQKTIFLKKVLSSDEILHMKIKYVPFWFSLFLYLFSYVGQIIMGHFLFQSAVEEVIWFLTWVK